MIPFASTALRWIVLWVDGPAEFGDLESATKPSPRTPHGPMHTIPAQAAPVSTSIAALLLTALPHLKASGLAAPTTTQVLESLGVSRSRAYELKARLEALLPTLVQPAGRPNAPAPTPALPDIGAEVLDFVYGHPGCVSASDVRRRYSDEFRLFVIDLAQRWTDIDLAALADAIRMPLGTLQDWLRGGASAVQTSKRSMPTPPDPRQPQIETVLAQWQDWNGTFVDFCKHLQMHHRLPFGCTLIGNILMDNGVRPRQQRPGRSPDEKALRGAFETFFPNAQWVGDGTEMTVDLCNSRFTFNLELNVDAYTGAFVGADIRRTEDSAAVIETFADAQEATGTRPLALLLDNKPSNHSAEVNDALGETMMIRATPYRPQNKAHIEGGFGLLKQTIDAIELSAGTAEGLARQILALVVTVWGRTINHRPRRDRDGRSRADLMTDKPTAAEVEQAKESLRQRMRQQEKARQTKAARQNPVVRARLAAAYERLGLSDPDGHLLTATAGYPLDAVVEGIAIFEGRQQAGTLPEGIDARYLIGIVRNLANENEAWLVAEVLWRERLAAQDLIFRELQAQLEAVEDSDFEPEALIKAYVERAGRSQSNLDRFFWLTAAADVIEDQDCDVRRSLFRLAARRIAAMHAVKARDRDKGIRFLAARLWPLR